MSKQQANSTVVKALMILKCFTSEMPELTIAQIAERVQLPTSSLYRYLQVMVKEGFLSHSRDTNTYALGIALIELGGIALTRYEVRRLGQSVLNRLERELNLDTNMAVLDDADIVHIAFSTNLSNEPWHTIIGRRSPAYTTAMGKVLLAYEPFESVQERLTRAGWQRLTEQSIDNFDRLAQELAQVRKRQIAYDLQEYNLGTFCVACPIRQQGGRVAAAMSVTCKDEERFMKDRTAIETALLGAAAELSHQLGYIGNAYT